MAKSLSQVRRSSPKKKLRSRALVLEALEHRQLLAADWRNPVNALDVTSDGDIVPLDALIIINELNDRGARELDTPRSPGQAYWDTTVINSSRRWMCCS